MIDSHDVDVASRDERQVPEAAEDLSHRVRAAAPDLAILLGFVLFALLLIGAALR
jgi:hypothetical protein